MNCQDCATLTREIAHLETGLRNKDQEILAIIQEHDERAAERDRARDVAVALENENAYLQALHDALDRAGAR